MSTSDKSIGEHIAKDGYLLREGLLDSQLFSELNHRVLCSWRDSNDWITRVKHGQETKIMRHQNEKATMRIRGLFNDHKIDSNANFQYLNHSLHQDRDQTGLINQICEAVRDAWAPELELLVGPTKKTNFSLTSFTTGCFLNEHNDFGGGGLGYKVTLLLYFGEMGGRVGDCNLFFDYQGKKTEIEAIPNRGILFIPTTETAHWVPESTQRSVLRLAFSGWLM